MTPVLWKEFPEINRKVAFSYNTVNPGAPLGCHCGYISGVSANFGNSYYAANNGKNVAVLDTNKEEQFPYRKEIYGGQCATPSDEILKVLKYIREIKLTFTDICAGAYQEIVTKCSSLPLWVMSDVINYEAPVRKPKSLMDPKTIYEVFGYTADFAKYLIDNDIGYVMASPIIQNPLHRSTSNYSLNQGWFWIPPKHMERAINVAEVHGDDKFPSKERWAKTVGGDLGLDDDKEILRSVLNDGVFPEDRRFQRPVAAPERIYEFAPAQLMEPEVAISPKAPRRRKAQVAEA